MCDLSMALWWGRVLSQAQSSKKTDFQEGLLRTCDEAFLALSCRGGPFSPFKFPNPNGPFSCFLHDSQGVLWCLSVALSSATPWGMQGLS